MSNPRDLSGETFNVIFLSLQDILRHKQRERAVPDAHLFDLVIEPTLDGLPDKVRSRLGHINYRQYFACDKVNNGYN
jgi:hypothetical protein